jgi:hypothetical protein
LFLQRTALTLRNPVSIAKHPGKLVYLPQQSLTIGKTLSLSVAHIATRFSKMLQQLTPSRRIGNFECFGWFVETEKC